MDISRVQELRCSLAEVEALLSAAGVRFERRESSYWGGSYCLVTEGAALARIFTNGDGGESIVQEAKFGALALHAQGTSPAIDRIFVLLSDHFV